MLLNCGVGEYSSESLEQQGDQTSQSILKETNPKYSLERLMLKLKLQYFGYLMWRTYLFEMTLMLGMTEDVKRRGWQRMRELDSITDAMDRSLSEGDQSWVFTGRTDAEAETPILWLPDVNSWLIRKDPDAGRDWGWEKGMTEDEMAGWHHWLDGQEFEWTPGVGDGQGGLACCDS